MRREEDQELWDLLGRARQPQLSAFFARDIVRRLREEPRRFEQVRNWFNPRWLIPASATAAILLVTVFLTEYRVSPRPIADNLPDAVVKVDPQDYEVVADLDELLASDENGLWDEDQTL
jgi:hypothetical protein